MWVLVSQLHSIHAHGHEETAIEQEHEDHEDHDHKD